MIMGVTYINRDGVITVGDVWTTLALQGSDATPGTVKVPAGKTKLKQIIYSIGDSVPTGAITALGMLLRIKGAGLKGQENQDYVLDGYTGFFVTAGSTAAPGPLRKRDVDVDVVENGILVIQAMATLGALGGNPEVKVQLGFE